VRQILLLAVCVLIVLSAGAAALLAAQDLHAPSELAEGASERAAAERCLTSQAP